MVAVQFSDLVVADKLSDLVAVQLGELAVAVHSVKKARVVLLNTYKNKLHSSYETFVLPNNPWSHNQRRAFRPAPATLSAK